MDTKQADQDELLALEATQERSACQHHWVASLYSMVNPTTPTATTGSGTWGVGVSGGASTTGVTSSSTTVGTTSMAG